MFLIWLLNVVLHKVIVLDKGYIANHQISSVQAIDIFENM